MAKKTSGSFSPHIGFEDLLIRCIIGVNPEERLVEQDLLVNLQVPQDVAKIAASDDISQANCYAAMADFCKELAQKGQYKMIETLAYELTQQLANKFNVDWVKVFIKKPSAIPTASFAYVEYEYRKEKS
jgi:7,8-dihydroneopterin aldolase/epimerase/oxygenase